MFGDNLFHAFYVFFMIFGFCMFLFGITLFVASSNFSVLSISFLVFIYLFFAFFFLRLNFELFSILLILIYIGGIMVLFMFAIFFSESSRTFSNIFANFSPFYISPIFLFSVFPFVFLNIYLLDSFFSALLTFFDRFGHNRGFFLAMWCLMSIKSSIVGAPDSANIIHIISSAMYIYNWISTFFCFWILLLVLVLVSSSKQVKEFNNKHVNPNLGADLTVNFGFSLTMLLEFIDVTFSGVYYFAFGYFFICLSAVFFLNAKSFNFLRFLIFIELLFLPIMLIMVFSSYSWFSADGLIFSFFLLSIFASETVLGLYFLVGSKNKSISFV